MFEETQEIFGKSSVDHTIEEVKVVSEVIKWKIELILIVLYFLLENSTIEYYVFSF